MNVIRGNLITLAKSSVYDVMIHGCNCFNTMNSGVAKDVKENFPKAWLMDQATLKGDRTKLGSYSHHYYPDRHHGLQVINAYTQYNYGRGLMADYDAIDEVFKKIGEIYIGSDLNIIYPRVGAGLAGGEWEIIKEIIDKRLMDCHHTLIDFDGMSVTQEQSYLF